MRTITDASRGPCKQAVGGSSPPPAPLFHLISAIWLARQDRRLRPLTAAPTARGSYWRPAKAPKPTPGDHSQRNGNLYAECRCSTLARPFASFAVNALVVPANRFPKRHIAGQRVVAHFHVAVIETVEDALDSHCSRPPEYSALT